MWVPSNYCKELFTGLTSLPIDIIPHVINVDVRLAKMSMPHSDVAGTIIYVFDGASYLRRKNPAALIRAFHRSGLARQGWRLRLKTKNFEPAGYDQQSYIEFQTALEQLRESYPGSVELITKDLEDAELKALIQSADIYASPHASEGFGLTIAEAMAAGVLVVATDYGGSRDLLDHTTGFPVRYQLIAEEFGHGSYQAGCVWARIDEINLAECLNLAALQCRQEAGFQRRENARKKVMIRCDVDAVAERMAAALDRIC
jgi:glycosyltransferase involved in cell wall biosynthesis